MPTVLPLNFTHKGFSIVELMIALALGSLVTIAATQLFLVNRQTENLQVGIASLQNNGRFALDFLGRKLMSAGYSSGGAIDPFIFDGADFAGQFSQDGVFYDELVMRMQGIFDCANAEDQAGIIRFYVEDEALRCAAYDDESGVLTLDDNGVLITNVKAFQVLYGIDFDGPDSAGFRQADLYTNATGALATTGAIVSVRFALLLGSELPVSTVSLQAPDTIRLLDQEYVNGTDATQGELDFSDRHLYRAFTSTVALRNLPEVDL